MTWGYAHLGIILFIFYISSEWASCHYVGFLRSLNGIKSVKQYLKGDVIIVAAIQTIDSSVFVFVFRHKLPFQRNLDPKLYTLSMKRDLWTGKEINY